MLKSTLVQPLSLRNFLPSFLDFILFTPLYQVDGLLNLARLDKTFEACLIFEETDGSNGVQVSGRAQWMRLIKLIRVDLGFEVIRDLWPEVLPAFDIAIDNVERLVSCGGLKNDPFAELGVQGSTGKTVKAHVKSLTTREDKILAHLLVDSGVNAQGRRQIHEVSTSIPNHVIGVRNIPRDLSIALLTERLENILLTIIEVWRESRLVYKPRVRFNHGILGRPKMDAILLAPGD